VEQWRVVLRRALLLALANPPPAGYTDSSSYYLTAPEEGMNLLEDLKKLEPPPEALVPDLVACFRDHSVSRKCAPSYFGLDTPASDVLARIGLPAVPALADAVQEEASADKAAWTLAQIGGPAVPALLTLARHPKPEIRGRAVTALGGILASAPDIEPGDWERLRRAPGEPSPARQAGLALCEAVVDPDVNVRHRALNSLYSSGKKVDPRALVPTLVANLDESEEGAHWYAPAILQSLGEAATPAFPALLAALGRADGGRAGALVEAVGALGPDAGQVVPALIEVNRRLRADSPCSALATALKRWPAEAVPPLLGLLEEAYMAGGGGAGRDTQ
jgi:HEAT repeat protein